MKERFAAALMLLIAVLSFTGAQSALRQYRRPSLKDHMDVAISPLAQVALAGGDRWLAANVNATRALMVGVMDLAPGDFKILGQVQRDVALLNPYHADNYYIAQAILPWADQLRPAQYVLERAAKARSGDIMPYFFLGFDAYYFDHDFIRSGSYFRAAADQTSGDQREQMLYMAAKFDEKADDTDLAIKVIQQVRESAKNPGLKAFLDQRILRLERLKVLREAARRYASLRGQPLSSLDQLVAAGILPALPEDPLNVGYRVDAAGVPQIVSKLRTYQDEKR
ncbi:MAG: hypothetical protein JO002_02830 [Burkholderiaceae bacterium]|nr:hypothetical protein [Burkholderiaceae bacterium]